MALNYKWYCKQPTETMDITKPNTISNIIPPSTSLVGKLQGDAFKGCFGNGPGLLDGFRFKGPVLQFNGKCVVFDLPDPTRFWDRKIWVFTLLSFFLFSSIF